MNGTDEVMMAIEALITNQAWNVPATADELEVLSILVNATAAGRKLSYIARGQDSCRQKGLIIKVKSKRGGYWTLTAKGQAALAR